jgi:hypothetical protein
MIDDGKFDTSGMSGRKGAASLHYCTLELLNANKCYEKRSIRMHEHDMLVMNAVTL